MRKFIVYPKEGKEFAIEAFKFEPTADGFVLYDYADRPTTDSFLSLHNIAAIIPEGVSEERERDRMICFLVHLKDRPPFKVYAHSFDSEPTVSFRYHHQDGYGAPISKIPVEGIYILLSEVVAILPSDGIGVYRH
jgi:hypothetical protein